MGKNEGFYYEVAGTLQDWPSRNKRSSMLLFIVYGCMTGVGLWMVHFLSDQHASAAADGSPSTSILAAAIGILILVCGAIYSKKVRAYSSPNDAIALSDRDAVALNAIVKRVGAEAQLRSIVDRYGEVHYSHIEALSGLISERELTEARRALRTGVNDGYR